MFRKPWNEENTSFLRKFWPHWGTAILADRLKLTRQQVKSKANRLGLKLLPREERLCPSCKIRSVKPLGRELCCAECFSSRRQQYRTERWNSDPLHYTLRSLLRTARSRHKKRFAEDFDLTMAWLEETWRSQSGLCAYSGRALRLTERGQGRDAWSLSLDRIDPLRGYTRDNVALVAWVVNAGKSDLTLEEYRIVCADISQHGHSPKQQ